MFFWGEKKKENVCTITRLPVLNFMSARFSSLVKYVAYRSIQVVFPGTKSGTNEPGALVIWSVIMINIGTLAVLFLIFFIYESLDCVGTKVYGGQR